MPTPSRNIFDYLDRVREHPSMYFFPISANEVEKFCHGYYAALEMHGLREQDVPKLSTWHFGTWLRRRFNWGFSRGWANAIRDHCSDDQEAFNRFFDLIQDYRKLRPQLVASFNLGAAHKPTGKEIFGSGAWPLPPENLQIFRYEPDEFYFLAATYRTYASDQQIFNKLEGVLTYAEEHWQIKREEWSFANATD